MSRRQELLANVAVLDVFPQASDLLQTAGLIVASGARLSLSHESLFDYLHARAFVRRRDDLMTFLLSAEQTLFRRTQVRQFCPRARYRPRALPRRS